MPTENQIKNRKRWLRALRSGKYKQGIGFLRTGEGNYCCLGVDAQLGGKLNRSFGQDSNGERCEVASVFRVKHYSSIAFPASEWMSKRHGISEAQATQLRRAAADDNDCGVPFKQIAINIAQMFKGFDDENTLERRERALNRRALAKARAA